MHHRRRRKPRGYALTYKITPATAMFAEELEQLARLTALRPDLRMVVGCSDSGWHFNWMTGVISIDGEKMTGESPDYNRGLVLHESAHAAITRLEGIVPVELLQDRRLFALLNVVEDCRIETWMQKRFPGCRPWVREYNDKLFSPVLENDGNLPLVGQFLNGILTRWWYGQAAEPMAEEVRQAVEAIWPAMQQILLALPPSPESLRGISDRYAQSPVAQSYAEADQSLPPGEYEMAVRLAQYDMWCRVHEDILPVYRRLLPPGQTVCLPLKLYLSRLCTAMPDRRVNGFSFSSRFPSVTLNVSSGSGGDTETALHPDGYDAYLKCWQEQYPVIEHTAENLLRLFRPSGRTRLREGCPSGSRLDLRMAMRFEADPQLYDRLWSRPLVPQRIDPHFTLVIDRSGSMEGEKIQQAFKGIVLLCEVCHRVGLPLNICSFASQAESLLDHGEKLSAGVRARLGTLTESADGDTNLANALSLVTENLKTAPFRDRFVFVVSDGLLRNDDPSQPLIAQLTGEGVSLVGLGLGPETHQLQNHIPNSRTNLTAAELPGVLVELLAETLKAI